jgi:hypothetical protein
MGGHRRLLFVVVVLAVGACGGDDGSPTVAETTAVPTTAVETTVAADPTAEITAVYEAFFDGTNTDMASKLALLESPDELEDIFNRAFGDPAFANLVSQVQGEVVTVTPTSDTTADVDYRLLLDGAPATEGTLFGRAVLVDGEWRIADATFCNVAGLGNPAYAQDPVCIEATGG